MPGSARMTFKPVTAYPPPDEDDLSFFTLSCISAQPSSKNRRRLLRIFKFPLRRECLMRRHQVWFGSVKPVPARCMTLKKGDESICPANHKGIGKGWNDLNLATTCQASLCRSATGPEFDWHHPASFQVFSVLLRYKPLFLLQFLH